MKKKQRTVPTKKEAPKPEPKPIHHHRTVFPLRVNFHGWWIRSKKGIIAQLVNAGRDRHDSYLYQLLYAETPGFPQTLGAGKFTTEDMINYGMHIYETKQEAVRGKETAILLGPAKTVG